MNNNVDIVITWVDGSDPNWLAEKKMYTKKSNNVRYRDWDNLVYIFVVLNNLCLGFTKYIL